MGLSNSFISLGRIVGPIWGGLALDFYAGLPYLSGALVMLLGFIVSLVWLPRLSPDSKSQVTGESTIH